MEIDFGLATGVMGILGLLCYLVSCCYHWTVPRIEKVIEAMGFGACIAIGARLIYGAFCPHELCHLVNGAGEVVREANLHIKFGDRQWEIIAGGVVLIIASIYSLFWVCKRPSHSTQPQQSQPKPLAGPASGQ
jgi:hypothetical protein